MEAAAWLPAPAFQAYVFLSLEVLPRIPAREITRFIAKGPGTGSRVQVRGLRKPLRTMIPLTAKETMAARAAINMKAGLR